MAVTKRSQIHRVPSVEVFDPRTGEDYQIPLGNRGDVLFSSLKHNCVVIRMSWMRGWWVKRIPLELVDPAVVNTVLQRTAEMGFLCVYPGDCLGALAGLGELEVHKCGEALFSHFRHDERTVASFLKEARFRATYEEWLIGSTMQKIDPVDVEQVNRRIRSPELTYFLTRFSTTGSVWAFNLDSGELTVVFRVFDGYEDIISRIVQKLTVRT